MNTLSILEVQEVNGGIVCGGLCVGGAFIVGSALGYIVVDWAMN